MINLYPFFISFLATFILTPLLARYFRYIGMLGIDLHKEERKEIPEMVGIAIFLGAFSALVYHGIFIPLIALNLVEVFGIYDGIFKLKAWQKLSSFFLIGIIYFYLVENVAPVEVLFLVSFLFMCAVNFTNMLAGFNGLEIGTGAIAMLGIFLSALAKKAELSMVISLSFLGALFAFLYYNKYPARVFPGDAGTLIIGAALFLAIYYGKLYLSGLLVFIPYIADASLKFFTAGIMTRESQKPTVIKGGKLFVPEKSNLSLPRLLLKIKPLSEKEVVYAVWGIELVFAILAVLASIL